MLLAACAAQRVNEPVATKPAAAEAADRGIAQPQSPEPTEALVPASVVEALAAHDYARALGAAEGAASSVTSPSPWLEYDRAEALAGLGRTDEALEAFKRSEQGFRSKGPDFAGESAAMWGRARALAEAGRCSEARTAFDDYAAFVRANDPAAAEMAAAHSLACRPVLSLH
jgi:hypothetical protein